MTDYDTIIIGAGNGGLTAALTLAQAGVKTLLLGRHNIPGGCATSFIRGRFEFKIALHQLSGLGTKEASGIEKFIGLVNDYAQQWINVSIMRDPEACKEKYPLYFQYYLKSTQTIFDQFFKDPKLMKALGVYGNKGVNSI